MKTPALFILLCTLLAATAQGGTLAINVTSYGAVANDGINDSAAFQSALNAIKNAGEGQLHVPAGTYHFDSLVQIDAALWNVAIIGDGQGQSVLVSRNALGIFYFDQTDSRSQITVSDLSLLAGQAGAGTALNCEMNTGGSQERRTLTVENVTIGALNTTQHYFNIGLSSKAMWRAHISNVTVSGSASTNVSDASPAFAMARGIVLTDSYAPALSNCTVSYASYGYFFDSTSNAEGGSFVNCDTNYCRTGIYYAIVEGEPGLIIDQCGIVARDFGVRIIARRAFQVINNQFTALSNSHPFVGVRLQNCQVSTVSNNTFNPKVVTAEDIFINYLCEGIVIGGNTLSRPPSVAVNIASGAQHILNLQ